MSKAEYPTVPSQDRSSSCMFLSISNTLYYHFQLGETSPHLSPLLSLLYYYSITAHSFHILYSLVKILEALSDPVFPSGLPSHRLGSHAERIYLYHSVVTLHCTAGGLFVSALAQTLLETEGNVVCFFLTLGFRRVPGSEPLLINHFLSDK